ncbi:YhcH/YjgK/YiaL family protein [Opitutia bacterium ISCC 51]|nr:YhcH/YjgK/YiaL family protein [Opitutae bacterium ISCC 51]QXD28221.1 YhcH/YjgK/YiaL family protein [Opitutae bacterium ISCC 52]
MITDTIANASSYSLGPAWDKAFAFLDTINADTADGDYPIDGKSIFAIVMSYETKEPDQARFEAHKKYADIQSTLAGAEGIAVVQTEGLTSTTDYEEDRDVTFYHTPEIIPTLVDVYPGSFAYLLPQDCHMPQLAVGAPQMIKKVVVKIALSELGL